MVSRSVVMVIKLESVVEKTIPILELSVSETSPLQGRARNLLKRSFRLRIATKLARRTDCSTRNGCSLLKYFHSTMAGLSSNIDRLRDSPIRKVPRLKSSTGYVWILAFTDSVVKVDVDLSEATSLFSSFSSRICHLLILARGFKSLSSGRLCISASVCGSALSRIAMFVLRL
ncbi:hypothetical protein B0O99DRAFT_639477, partial [Bisporella sp. PMI_857]